MLRRLADDISRYHAAGGPAEEELAAAPSITNPNVVPDLSACRLAGFVSGHPLVRAGPGTTSRIHAIDVERRWVRTYSRLWRLDPADRPHGRRSETSH